MRCQESRVLLNVGGTFFATSRTALTVVPGSILEAMFSRRHTTATDEDERVFTDRDDEHFGIVLNFLRDCGSDTAADAIRALPNAHTRAVRRKLDYYGPGDAVFWDRFSLERASFEPGPDMGAARSCCSAVVLPGDREASSSADSARGR